MFRRRVPADSGLSPNATVQWLLHSDCLFLFLFLFFCFCFYFLLWFQFVTSVLSFLHSLKLSRFVDSQEENRIFKPNWLSQRKHSSIKKLDYFFYFEISFSQKQYLSTRQCSQNRLWSLTGNYICILNGIIKFIFEITFAFVVFEKL